MIIEVVFGWPGIGRVVYSAIQSRDYPLLQGSMLLLVCSLVVINFLVDILYTYIDPRISYVKK